MRTLPFVLAIAVVAAAARPAAATIYTYYEEDFTDDANNEGTHTAPGSYTDDNGNWSIDSTGTNFENGNDYALVRNPPATFQFRDLGGNSQNAGTTEGVAIFTSAMVSFEVGDPGLFTFLQMTMTAFLDATAVSGTVDDIVIESIVNNVVTDTTTLNTAGGVSVTHDISDNIVAGTNTYQLRITVRQNVASNGTHFIDNLLLQGNATPEPASLSMLGMAAVMVCGAGWRRRRSSTKRLEAST